MDNKEFQDQLINHEERIKLLEMALSKKNNLENQKKDPTKKKSVSELLAEKKPSDDLQKTALFAYYQEKYEGQEFFNSEEVRNCFIKSKSTKPSNINDKINQCIKKEWISEHAGKKDGKKAFYLTNTGISIVESGFQM